MRHPSAFGRTLPLLLGAMAAATAAQMPPARSARLHAPDDPAWADQRPTYGAATGRTTVRVSTARAVPGQGVTFGIPVGQAASPDHVQVLDDAGKAVAADVVALGHWPSQPARWALVSFVADPPPDGQERSYTVAWGGKAQGAKATVTCELDAEHAVLRNGLFELTVTPAGVVALKTADGRSVPITHWRPAFIPKGGEPQTPGKGIVRLLYDGRVHKKLRVSSRVSPAVEIQQEFDIYAGSPLIGVAVRFINRTLKDQHLDGIVPVEWAGGPSKVAVGLAGGKQATAAAASVRQRAFGWQADVGNLHFEGAADDLGEWMLVQPAKAGVPLLWVFPRFQAMAAGDDDLESVLSCGDGTLRLHHYRRIAPTADVRLRETMARTFHYAVVVDAAGDKAEAWADAVKRPPHVALDRAHLTAMGVFQERRVSHLFDRQVHEAAAYYLRARVPRAEYPRCQRGVDPGRDKSGEGAYEVNLHGGGMVAYEVFQYFTPKPSAHTRKMFGEELGYGPQHIVTGGSMSYRNGDIPLALWQEALRSGDRALGDFARAHTELFADYGVTHADGLARGVGHYYCNWYGNPYVYQRFEGTLLGYLATGDPWLLETARDMADYCVRAWRDGHPCDAAMNGRFGGVQYRSAYIAKMLVAMADLTGEPRYRDVATDLAIWAIRVQEKEGWWVMGTSKGSREFRCTPIFAGYQCQGLWPLYWRTKNAELKACLLRCADWYLLKQEAADGSNPGTFPNSYWYGKFMRKGRAIRGNYATSSHVANALLQSYLATDDLKYFYSANAAWVGVLNHQTPEGGVPLENSLNNSVWSHVMAESLHQLGVVAEARKLPFVLSTRTGVPGTSFMGKGATWADGVFRFGLKYRHKQPVPARVFFPAGEPAHVRIGGAKLDFAYNRESGIVAFALPASKAWRVAAMELRAGGGSRESGAGGNR